MSVKVKIDRSAFAAVARELRDAEKVVAIAQARAINKVAEKTMTRSRREIVSRVNLKQDYVRERMGLFKASPESPEAVITARVRPTRLATYGAKQLVRSAKRAKGDARRGIPGGKKAAGVSVSVKAGGGRKKMPGAFLLPLRAGKVDGGNGMGVFIRVGSRRNVQAIAAQQITESKATARSGEIRHLYGPSVDQVFGYVIDDINQSVQQELDETVAKQLDYEIRKALKTK